MRKIKSLFLLLLLGLISYACGSGSREGPTLFAVEPTTVSEGDLIFYQTDSHCSLAVDCQGKIGSVKANIVTGTHQEITSVPSALSIAPPVPVTPPTPVAPVLSTPEKGEKVFEFAVRVPVGLVDNCPSANKVTNGCKFKTEVVDEDGDSSDEVEITVTKGGNTSCNSKDNCSANQECLSGICVDIVKAECSKDSDCASKGSDFICLNNSCQQKIDDGSCTNDSECGAISQCVDSVCVQKEFEENQSNGKGVNETKAGVACTGINQSQGIKPPNSTTACLSGEVNISALNNNWIKVEYSTQDSYYSQLFFTSEAYAEINDVKASSTPGGTPNFLPFVSDGIQNYLGFYNKAENKSDPVHGTFYMKKSSKPIHVILLVWREKTGEWVAYSVSEKGVLE